MPHLATPASWYHLDAEQVAAFDRDGFLVLRQRIPSPLLGAFQAAAARWLDEAERLEPDAPENVDHRFATSGGDARLWRIDYLHALGDPVTLTLLGSPQVLGIAESLAGPDLVPTYESLVVKQRGDGAPVKWHQDAVHPRRHRVFNVDVYLDRSTADAGALRVIPGSHRQPVDVCEVADRHGWAPPGVLDVEMEPGDVLVHDVMIVHGSPSTSGVAPLRRTVYLEFRSAQQILEEGPWDADWIDARLRLLPVALRAHAAGYPSAAPFVWRAAAGLRPRPLGDDDVELRVVHEVHSPGSWCSAGGVLTR
jgi:ectoine hydroxylase-related dioxygenase (phytanoyl-CoA dioxygenase family)